MAEYRRHHHFGSLYERNFEDISIDKSSSYRSPFPKRISELSFIVVFIALLVFLRKFVSAVVHQPPT